jgi:hypothetical protein
VDLSLIVGGELLKYIYKDFCICLTEQAFVTFVQAITHLSEQVLADNSNDMINTQLTTVLDLVMLNIKALRLAKMSLTEILDFENLQKMHTMTNQVLPQLIKADKIAESYSLGEDDDL